jgi:hypothetical protein
VNKKKYNKVLKLRIVIHQVQKQVHLERNQLIDLINLLKVHQKLKKYKKKTVKNNKVHLTIIF